ncbi:MAG: FAD-dependent oxidoreductase [Proteobacteria bacterium]|nr:FAD-dependent oxidoreductase [Pseudomonadota bacterium]
MLYLTKLQLQAELNRCLTCKTQPCMSACPVSCNPQEFIRYAREGEWENAVHAITRYNPMGQTCGLICPDKFCMKACTRCHVDFPINIPRVQATILNEHRTQKEGTCGVALNGFRIAIIGAGPAGMAAAMVLGKSGFCVDIYESRDEVGGALNMIPEERLPHSVIEKDWSFIFEPDRMRLLLNSHVEDPAELCKEYDGVIVATGEPNCLALRIPGEELSVSYMDYLYHPEQYRTSGCVAVIGGGNVAVDCALTAARLGARSVEMFIRRRLVDMRISKKEHMELLEHKINANGMMSPEKIEKNGDLLKLWVRRNVFDGEKWTALPNSTIALPYFDLVIRAIGSRADEKNESIPTLIYAGDCKTGGSTIVEAIASGKNAAEAMIATVLHQ